MHTATIHHHPTTPLRVMDFVVLALLALALAFVAQSDRSQDAPTPTVSQPS